MKLAPSSLFGRLFALSLLATLAALVVSGVAIGGVLERFVTGGVDARLGDRLAALESAVRPDGSLDGAQLARVARRIAPDEPWRIERPNAAVGRGGAIAIADDGPRPGPRPPRREPPPAPPAVEGDGTPFEGRMPDGRRVHGLTATLPTAVGEVRVIVAVPRTAIDRPVLAALAPLAGSLAILGLALGGAALIQLRLGLKPLRTLRSAVAAIRLGRATRVPEDVPDELAPLARELNALAVDNAAALAGARTAAANLAHALKTPIATLSLHLASDVAAQAQLARIDATLRHHLGRARAAAIDRRSTTPLAPALAELAATIEALHGSRVSIDLDVADGLVARVDPQDFAELAGNIIDNAARYATTAVTLTARAGERQILLTVADDGSGIPADERARAMAPGARLDERGDGHGFGLAITRELVELYGGTLILEDAPGGGLLASISLPYAAW